MLTLFIVNDNGGHGYFYLREEFYRQLVSPQGNKVDF